MTLLEVVAPATVPPPLATRGEGGTGGAEAVASAMAAAAMAASSMGGMVGSLVVDMVIGVEGVAGTKVSFESSRFVDGFELSRTDWDWIGSQGNGHKMRRIRQQQQRLVSHAPIWLGENER